MRITRLAVFATLALAVGLFAGFGPGLQAGTVAPANPLKPLSERDMASTREMGCTCAFSTRRATFIQVIGNEFMLRTASGRAVCRITDRQFSALSGGRGTIACGGKQLTLRPTGGVVSHEESDSASGPAALTVSQRGRSQVMRGDWGCAC